MKTLVVGATGATGKHVVHQLLEKGEKVKIIVRSQNRLSDEWKNNPNLEIITASVADIPLTQWQKITQDCKAFVSCLGHNMTWKGIFGKPRKLVTDTVKAICEAVQLNNTNTSTQFVLMNTSGNVNKDMNERVSFAEKMILALLRLCVPPHVDNEAAAEYLRAHIGQDHPNISWVAVRPDSLTEESSVTTYNVHPSPIRSPLFDAGKTSRINVAHFMTSLLTDAGIWDTWKGKMPVIYNNEA